MPTWRVRNVHERLFPGTTLDDVSPLFATLGTPADRFWPGTDWSPMVLDRAASKGAHGGHGGIRYTCTAHLPNRLVEFTFDDVNGRAVDGRHVLEAVPRRAGTLVRHTLDLECSASDWIELKTLVVPAHDAVVEQLLDNIERSITGAVTRPHRWGLRVLLIRRLFGLPTTMAPWSDT
ncbi:hypothetical protein BKG84_12835 [Mycobacteroides chelonae]|uniref:SRPBCC family protein n=1 Tax=Mycobacteroides chelonae TaxID=1774 RepID=A0A1S1MCU5_MYCCH|nr:hypothetical protein BKG84_12835 [Mycobacteroides chelonae]